MAHSIWNLSSATGWLQTFEKLNLFQRASFPIK